MSEMGVGCSLIGAALLEPHRVIGVAADRGLKVGHFVHRLEGAVWELLVDRLERKGTLDLLLAIQECERVGLDQKMEGGAGQWLSDCIDACVTAAHAESYVMEVIDLGMRRDLTECAHRLAGDVQRDPDARSVAHKASNQIVEILDGACDGADVAESNGEAAKRLADVLCAATREQPAVGLPYPWEHVDQMTCGLSKGMIVLAGRPSAGKTSIEDQICVNLAREGVPVGRITLDGTRDELLQRAGSRIAEVSLPRLKQGFVGESHKQRFRDAMDLIGTYPMFFEDKRRDLDGIVARAREWKRKHDIQLLTLDFLQLVSTGDIRVDRDRVARAGMISGTMKALSLELGIPVLVLSQLSRAMEKENRDPVLSDLRDSGEIEQDAHQVVFVHIDTKTRRAMEEERPGWTKTIRPVWFDLLKNKDGAVGRVPLIMAPNYFKFEEPKENQGTDTVMGFDTLMELGLMPKAPDQ